VRSVTIMRIIFERERSQGMNAHVSSHGCSLVGFYGRDGVAAQVDTSPEGSEKYERRHRG
jgi:hypothetical protein